AMPPVPSNCAAIIRSPSSGPRKILTRPRATIASTKPAAASKNSGIRRTFLERPEQPGLVVSHLIRQRLFGIQRVHEKHTALVHIGRERARHEARHRQKEITHRARGNATGIGDKTRTEGKPRVESTPGDIHSGNDGTPNEMQPEQGKGKYSKPSRKRRKETLARPGRCCGCSQPNQQPGGICAVKHDPNAQKNCEPKERGTQRASRKILVGTTHKNPLRIVRRLLTSQQSPRWRTWERPGRASGATFR